MSLTDTAIKRLQPTDKCTPNRPDKYSDGNGLELWVRHTGNKVWYADYTYQGKRIRGFGINSKTIKIGANTTAKGYDKLQFIPIGSGIYRQRLMNWRSNRPNLGNTPYFIRG